MSNLAAAPVAALVFIGLMLTVLGLFGGAFGVMALGVASLFGAGLIGAVSTRRA